MNPVILTSAYWPPVQYFTKLYAAPYVIMESHDHYVKQTYRNRCVIAGPNGALALTIPVEHEGTSRPVTGNMRISSHGNWRHLHWNALVSAYEKSPYFFYYADDFHVLYERPFERLVDFNEAIMKKVCELLDLHPAIKTFEAYYQAENNGCGQQPAELDLRETIRPKIDFHSDTHFHAFPYYQVFQQKNGFLPNLSVADLLFNMGPESRIVLRRSIVD